jgi:hypothetical protein
MLFYYPLNNIHQGRTLTSSNGKSGSLEETAEAVSINNLIYKSLNRMSFRFAIKVVNVYQYVLIMKIPKKLKHYLNKLLKNKMVD